MHIKVLDLLFDDQVCSLVYIQDLTKFVEQRDREKQTDELMQASQILSEKLETP